MSGEALLERLRGVRLLSLDVDGVLTDGGLYYTDEGITLRRFNVKDGMGIKLLQRHTDVQVAIVSAGKNDAIAHRGRDLGIEHVRFRVADKLSALTDICAGLGLTLAQAAHVGDDVNDVPLMHAVGCPMTMADALDPAKAAALYVTAKGGGQGGVREICDLILASRGVTV
ncbi:MAG: HAD hydrolase family protein [Rhodobacterales bacterium]|nr:HAD hydrolase family protein [Rhodobacterales bacterium]